MNGKNMRRRGLRALRAGNMLPVYRCTRLLVCLQTGFRAGNKETWKQGLPVPPGRAAGKEDYC
jgi:hypothetical protein